ncbi:MAG: hypothetical protein A2V78_08540 [Betaproteobacteria bacterium RBG_16_64_18]|nr:MAG: hypothetical protein A2V78_08540 [Betaproteobacteria bacterium RBG_16_64_18]
MLTFIRVLCLLLLAAVSGSAWPAQVFSGQLSGSFSGAAGDGSGNYSGSIEGAWNASGTSDASGVFVETVGGSGSFGGSGFAGNWRVAGYNPQTKSISITWDAAGGRGPASGTGTADGTTTLVVDTATGVATGGFQGQVYTAQGVKTLSGTWTVRFQGAADTVVTGKVQGSFSGTASDVGAVNGTVSGDWTVRFMPDGSVAGTASGSYDGGNISVAGYGAICICGNWLANIVRGSDGQFRLEGSWTHPVVSGTLDGRGGGPIVWYIDTSTAPMQASGNFDGSVGFSVTIPILGTATIPVSVGGSWNAVLPINP